MGRLGLLMELVVGQKGRSFGGMDMMLAMYSMYFGSVKWVGYRWMGVV